MAAYLADADRSIADRAAGANSRFERRSKSRAAGGVASLSSWLASSRDLSTFDPVGWDKLGANALAANPFYASTYVKGGLATIDAVAGVSAFMVRARAGQLVGLFPMRKSLGMARSARNIYQFSGTPLVHRDHAEDVIAAWMLAMAQGDLPRCWQFSDIQLGGELYDAMARTARRLGLSLIAVNTYERPQLTRLEGGFQEHLTSVLGKSRRKELERCLRRLNERGTLRLDRANTPATVAAALEAYLNLENAGWKGRAGTAFLSHGDEQFARAVFRNTGPTSDTIIDTLLLNDQPIAISINLASGSVLFTPKCTYDETLRSYAPGLVLEYLVIERFYRDPQFIRMDAATTVTGHVVQGLWNESVPMGTLFVGPAPLAARAAWVARTHARLKACVKQLLGTKERVQSRMNGLIRRNRKTSKHRDNFRGERAVRHGP